MDLNRQIAIKISIEPSYLENGWIKYNDGAVVVAETPLGSVEIKYMPFKNPGGDGGPGLLSLGIAENLPGKINSPVLRLPEGLAAANLWAEGRDENGAAVRSNVLAKVGYEGKTISDYEGFFSVNYPRDFLAISHSEAAPVRYCGPGVSVCLVCRGDGKIPGINWLSLGVFAEKNLKFSGPPGGGEFLQIDGTDFFLIRPEIFSAPGEKIRIYSAFKDGVGFRLEAKISAAEGAELDKNSEDLLWLKLTRIMGSFKFKKKGLQPPDAELGREKVEN